MQGLKKPEIDAPSPNRASVTFSWHTLAAALRSFACERDHADVGWPPASCPSVASSISRCTMMSGYRRMGLVKWVYIGIASA